MMQYLDYVQGRNLSNRMPLYVRTEQRLSVNDTMWHMRNHYEGTWLDHRSDVGAGPWSSPYRLGEGLTWSYGNQTYVNERNIGVHYAGWNVICHQRPKERYSVLWFGAHDSTFSVHAPFYGAVTRIPRAYDGANCTGRAACRTSFGLPGNMNSFALEAMHWATRLVANYAYSRYDVVAPVVQAEIVKVEEHLFQQVPLLDEALRTLDEASAVEYATNHSAQLAERVHRRWAELFGELFMTYVDGYKTAPDPKDQVAGVSKDVPHFSESWKKRIVESTGDRYKVPEVPSGQLRQGPAVISKLSLRGVNGPYAKQQQLLLQQQQQQAAVV